MSSSSPSSASRLPAADPVAAGLDPEALSRLEGAIVGDMAAGKHHSASVIVARRGVIGYANALGESDPRSEREARLDDRYFLMSVTKSFTAALILKAIDRGDLGFDTRIAEVIPEFGQRGKQRITVRHLLTHTAGLYTGFEGAGGLGAGTGVGDLEAATAALVGWPNAHRPGARVIYTPWENFVLLGEVVRRLDAQGRRFRDIASQELFEPLGMEATSIGLAVDHPERVPILITGARDGQAQTASIFDDLNHVGEEFEFPGGGGLASAGDVLTFAEMLRGRGTSGSVRVLSPAIVDYAYRNHTGDLQNEFWDFNKEAADLDDFPANFTLGGGYVRGTGHHLTPLGLTASPRAFGAVGSGSTSWMVDPDRDLTVVFLTGGLMQGLSHFQRLQRIHDLAIASVL